VQPSCDFEHYDAVVGSRLRDLQIRGRSRGCGRVRRFEPFRHAQHVFAVAAHVLQVIHDRPHEMHAEPADPALGQRRGEIRGADRERVERAAVVFGLDRQLGAVAYESNRDLVLAVALVGVANDVREDLVEREGDVERDLRGELLPLGERRYGGRDSLQLARRFFNVMVTCSCIPLPRARVVDGERSDVVALRRAGCVLFHRLDDAADQGFRARTSGLSAARSRACRRRTACRWRPWLP
jgi:hypothetical protein